MRIIETDLPGVFILELPVFQDERGYFQEVWNPMRAAIPALATQFVQDNIAFSHRGVLRGLHYQRPFEQAKLIVVLTGEIFDVAVDVRPDSPTFGRWIGTTLTAGSGRALYIPEGFAHGYQVLSTSAHVVYKCSEVYHSEAEHSIAWNDPLLAISWPLADPILSDKDRNAPNLSSVGVSGSFA